MNININEEKVSETAIDEEQVVKEEIRAKKFKRIIIIIDILILALLVITTLVLTVVFWENIRALTTEKGKNDFIKYIRDSENMGVFILIIAQVLQVVVAFIPGEVIEVAAGLVYGTWWGLLICEIGLIIGTLIIIGLVKLLGKPFMQAQTKGKKSTLKVFDDPVRALVIFFFIFLIPGVPKDMFIYLVPFTKVKIRDFIIVASIARIPSIITSTVAGAALASNDFWTAGWLFGIMGVLSIVGIIFNKQICEVLNKIFKSKKDATSDTKADVSNEDKKEVI